MNQASLDIPQDPGLRRAWGLYKAGRSKDADLAFRRVLHGDPGSAAAWNGIGLLAYRERRFADAERAFRKALLLNPDSAVLKHRLGIALRGLGQVGPAIKLYEAAAKALPRDAVFHSNWGNALVEAGRTEEAIAVLTKAVAIDPATDLFRLNLCKALIKADRGNEAVSVLISGPGDPDRVEIAAELGNAFLNAGRYREAVAALQRARAGGRAETGVLHNLGTALQYLGAMKEAEAVYREAIAKSPDTAASRRQLAGIVSVENAGQEIDELRAALKQPQLSPADRAEIFLGLAKALDDIGEYAEAFSSLQDGNQLIRMTLGYDADKNTEFVDRSIETFTRSFLEERRDWGSRSDRPVFIVGMPRSGTTLVEQILCSHPNVHGAGELLTISELFHGLRKILKPDLGLPRVAGLITPELTVEIARSYLDYIETLDADSRFVSDKMPFNYRYLGLISLLFPNARIIYTERHPLDVGLSCYFARFRENLNFSFNLCDMGRYYRDYQRLTTHWMSAIKNPILVMRYEQLIADQEAQTRRMLEFCDLEWDDRCLDFHLTDRPVLTASNWQVRQPIYAKSVGRWRHYRDWLGPLAATAGVADPEAWYSPARNPGSAGSGAEFLVTEA